jgi:hypothetical protein
MEDIRQRDRDDASPASISVSSEAVSLIDKLWTFERSEVPKWALSIQFSDAISASVYQNLSG